LRGPYLLTGFSAVRTEWRTLYAEVEPEDVGVSH
jgi:hypothetical protein